MAVLAFKPGRFFCVFSTTRSRSFRRFSPVTLSLVTKGGHTDDDPSPSTEWFTSQAEPKRHVFRVSSNLYNASLFMVEPVTKTVLE